MAAPQRVAAPKKAFPARQAAALPLEKSVAAHQAAARKLAAQSKWKAALNELGKAQREVRLASRATPPPAKLSAAYLKESEALRKQFGQQRLLACQGKADLAVALKKYSAGRKALNAKYGLHTPGKSASLGLRSAKDRAHFLLLESTLSDQAAEYFARSGNRTQAQKAREDALRDRVVAYQSLAKHPQADAAAEKLLALNPNRPDLFRTVGEYYEDTKRYERAAPVWQRLVGLLEVGRPTGLGSGSVAELRGSANRQLALCYRRLAFCQSRLGKKAEAEAALRKAGDADARVNARNR